MTLEEPRLEPGTELWCAGLRLVGGTALEEDERSALEGRARKELRRARGLKWLTTAAAVVASVGVGLLVFGSDSRGVKDIASMTFAGVAIAMFGCGFLGAVAEVVFGRTVPGRAFFLVSAVVAFVGGPWRFVSEPAVLQAGTVALIVILFLGNTMLILRWREGRREYRLFRAVLDDVARGKALEFAAPSTRQPDSAEEEGDDEGPELLQSAQVLPTSNLVLRIDGKPVLSWQVLPVVLVASVPDVPAETAPGQRSDEPPRAAESPKRRPLTSQEIKELTTFRKTMVRRLPLGILGIAYAAAVIVRIVENASLGRVSNGISLPGWGAVALIAVGYLVKRMVDARRLAEDAKDGTVIVLCPSNGGPERPPISEILPQSGLRWTDNGIPAGWRTTR